MSGSSLDGLDIVFTELTEISGKWSFEILSADCIPYDDDWKNNLSKAHTFSVPDFLRLHTAYGNFLGEQVNQFITSHELLHKIHFIASHGHTVWHEPSRKTTSQIGDGAAIAAITGLPAITDLRNVDIALGGQGAPIVPVADKFLLKEYDFCLNIGGIANVTVNGDNPVAFDICPANQLLDFFAKKLGKDYDDNGSIASSGKVDNDILSKINELSFYKTPYPKSLHNGFVLEEVLPYFDAIKSTEDCLHTATVHIAQQISRSILSFGATLPQKMLVTGGGAFNKFLLKKIDEFTKGAMELVVPDENLINYKEALAMALLGALRWREEENIWSSVTGATRNSVGGAIWLS